jgi:hypothetical protein
MERKAEQRDSEGPMKIYRPEEVTPEVFAAARTGELRELEDTQKHFDNL